MHAIPADEIQTVRLQLSPLRPSDAAEMVSVLAAPELYEFTGGEAPDIAALDRRYRAQIEGPSTGEERWYNWIARLIESGRPVGFVQATVLGTSADLAWLTGTEYHRRGFATEAASAMCDWLVAHGVQRLAAHIHPDHVASERVAANLGLRSSGEIDADGEVIWTRSVGA